MTVLLINEAARTAIEAALAKARAQPIPWSRLSPGAVDSPGPTLTLAERKPGYERPSSEQVMLERGYRAAISFEEQPAGLCRHLSVSVGDGTKVPNEPAFDMIAQAFGFDPIRESRRQRAWVEEFEDGRFAINLVQVETGGTDAAARDQDR